MGVQISGASSSPGGNEKLCGITPATVTFVPSTRITRPTMPGSPAKARCHKSCDRITTRGAPGTSSWGVMARPSSGDTPSDGNSPPVTDRCSDANRVGRAGEVDAAGSPGIERLPGVGGRA